MEAVTPEDRGRSEGSLVTSLAELRAIELERQTEERAAAEAVAAARQREHDAAAQAARDAVAARIAAERAAELAAEQARAAAERDARLEVERTEAVERARRMVALEEHRLAEELALQREVAQRQRPRGLMAVSAAALAAAAWLGWFALDCRRDAAAAAQARDRAIAAQAQAGGDARDARAVIDLRDRELAALRTALAAANHRATEAEHDAGLRAGSPPHRGPGPAARPRPPDGAPPPPGGVHIPDDCLVNPLCDPAAGHGDRDPQPRRK